MREITLEFARQQLQEADSDIPESVQDIVDTLPPCYAAMVPYMIRLWRTCGMTEFRPFVVEIGFTLERSQVVARQVQDVLASGHVLDMGCGWGGLTKVLSDRGYRMSSFDHVLEHAVVTKLVNPEARVYQGDVRNADLLPDAAFDLACMKDVLEHVGDFSQPIGPSGRNYAHQYRAVREVARVLRVGGTALISTGNYAFPWDGEVNRWTNHWLPEEARARYMRECHFDSDRYWLLTWEEIRGLFQATGLEVQEVAGDAMPVWHERFLDHLDKGFVGFEPELKRIWAELMEKDPRFLPCWYVRLIKATDRPKLPLDNLPLALRMLGGQTDDLKEGINAISNLLRLIAESDR